MSGFDIPVDIEKSDISIDLNSVILFIFLMGMYTIIYVGTIYVHFTKNPSKNHLVPAAITMLYLSSIVQMAVQWYSTKWQFIDNGDTRQSVFLAIDGGPQWILIAINASLGVAFTFADGLLIWRCFHVWNRSLRIILLPVLLIVAESALFLVQISFSAKYTDLTIPPAVAASLNAVVGAAYFVSFGTTLVTTVLIAYRIHSVSKEQGPSSKRFKHVMDIVIQSGVVYALSQLTTALAGVVPGASMINNTKNVAFEDYAQFINLAIAGISSTVMVARVAMHSTNTAYPSTSVHLSGLRFHMHSTHPTVNIEAMDVPDSNDGGQFPARQGQVVEEKVQ